MWLTFIALTLSIWSLASGWHKGEPAVFALHPMAIGDVVRDADVSLGYIDGATVDYIDDVSLLIGKQLTAPLSAGQPITATAVSRTRTTTNRVIINLPLEDSDPSNYVVGTRVHLWSLGDEFSSLVSVDATVVGSSASSLGSSHIAVSIPLDDEAAVMQARAVRVGALS